MEQTPIRKGYLYRPQKAGLKKHWVKQWGLLYSATETQCPRLETYDSKEAAAKEGTKPIVCMLLSGSIQATPTTQHRSRDFVLQISIDDKAYTYAVDSKEELDTWLEVFGEVAEGRLRHQEASGNRTSIVPDLPFFGGCGEADEGLQENTFYDSYESMAFNVGIRSTSFSEFLNLQGNYTLQVDSVKLSLLDEHTNNFLYAWPYRYLRRYGRDKTSFSMEAGRKCESGPGLIVFETKDGNDIFLNIQNFVNNISGRNMTSPALTNQGHSGSRDGHHESGRIRPPFPGKPVSQGNVRANPPIVASRSSPPVDPVGTLVAESNLFKQKQKERKGAVEQGNEVAWKEPIPWTPKSKIPKGTKERQPTPPKPDSEPQPDFEPDPLYSEVQENPDKTASEPALPIPEEEEMYALPEGNELPLRPPMPNITELPESSEYDFLNTAVTPSNFYDTTLEEPLGEAWRIFGRTEDNIHTETYIKGMRIVEDEETSGEAEQAKPIKPPPFKSKPSPKPSPLPKTRPTVRIAKNTKAPDVKKDPVPNDPSDQTYDRVGSLPAPSTGLGSSPTNDPDVYDHFVRPVIAHPVPAPRKSTTNQPPPIDDQCELYDHLQRETNTGGTRMTAKTYVPKQKSFDPDEAYDVLRIDEQANGSSGSLSNLAAGTLPEESQYSEANAQPSSLDTSINEPEENVYDVVEYSEA